MFYSKIKSFVKKYAVGAILLAYLLASIAWSIINSVSVEFSFHWTVYQSFLWPLMIIENLAYHLMIPDLFAGTLTVIFLLLQVPLILFIKGKRGVLFFALLFISFFAEAYFSMAVDAINF